MCVCTLFYDTVYKCNILNAAEKRLILCEHFTLKHPSSAHNCICYVSEVCEDGPPDVLLRSLQYEVGGQHLWR